jgi:hypothetical protein
MMWRHGDVLIASAKAVPANATRRPSAVLARGEFTGHSHRFAEPETVAVWEAAGVLFVTVLAEQATVIHEEHKPITLPHGIYRVWQQREYTPQAIVRVVD